MKNNWVECPIWKTGAELCHSSDGFTVDSPRAGGQYRVPSRKVLAGLECDVSVKARLTTWMNDQRRLGVDCPKLRADTIKDAEKCRPLPVDERADRLLRFLETLERYPGSGFPQIDYSSNPKNFLLALSWIESSVGTGNIEKQREEIEFFAAYLQKQGWIEDRPSNPNRWSRRKRLFRLTMRGHARLTELREVHKPSVRAFVAMWFGESMHEVYEIGIDPAIRGAGYNPVRIDRKEHANKIDDEIIAEIRRARFVVADFTHGEEGVRGGVYYEAGFAQGLGIPVIFSCREDMIKELHFDTRQYNHIAWNNPEELRDRLLKRIAAILGDGPITPRVETLSMCEAD